VIESDEHESKGPNIQQRDGNMFKRPAAERKGEKKFADMACNP
jgi:hypothetical protein